MLLHEVYGSDNPQMVSWFRNSKMVDAGGKPLTFFHGTTHQEKSQPISSFKVSPDGLLGTGIYFTPNRDYAGDYATQEGGYVMPVFLRIENPLVVEHNPDGAEVVKQIALALEDFFFTKGACLRWARDQFEDYAGIGDEEYLNMLREMKYDGVVLKKGTEIVEVTALSSFQVKSAIGNYGSYSTQSNKVHESVGNK